MPNSSCERPNAFSSQFIETGSHPLLSLMVTSRISSSPAGFRSPENFSATSEYGLSVTFPEISSPHILQQRIKSNLVPLTSSAIAARSASESILRSLSVTFISALNLSLKASAIFFIESSDS